VIVVPVGTNAVVLTWRTGAFDLNVALWAGRGSRAVARPVAIGCDASRASSAGVRRARQVRLALSALVVATAAARIVGIVVGVLAETAVQARVRVASYEDIASVATVSTRAAANVAILVGVGRAYVGMRRAWIGIAVVDDAAANGISLVVLFCACACKCRK